MKKPALHNGRRLEMNCMRRIVKMPKKVTETYVEWTHRRNARIFARRRIAMVALNFGMSEGVLMRVR